MLDGNVTVTAVEWILRLRNAADKNILGKSTIILLKVSCEGYMQTSRCYGLHAALKQNPIRSNLVRGSAEDMLEWPYVRQGWYH